MIERYRGSLLGLAAGDAVGASVEFKPPGTFPPVTDMLGGGPFDLQPGQWTDDTSMALCLAESLVVCQGFDPADQLRRYARWLREGYLSSTGRYFDSGRTVRGAISRFLKTGEPYGGDTDEWSAGNGSLMRLAPVALRYAAQPRAAVEWAAASSRTTHGAPAAVDACRYFAGLIVGALTGASKDELLAPLFAPFPGCWEAAPLAAEVREVAEGSFKRRQPPEIEATGYVIRSLEAALWAFCNSSSFAEGCLLAVNLGYDADTTAAVYGQLAGAFYGEAAIPAPWRERLALLPTIVGLAEELHRAAWAPTAAGAGLD
ncbi:MAG TPA: ADP-ribosylglycohydrolase family protein [Herpetosiphonaceae bacterium]